MKIYLAAAFNRKAELQSVKKALVEMGHEVTSRWLDGDPDPRPHLVAQRDLADIDDSDLLVVFTAPRETPETSGHHFEAGYAYGKDIPVWIVGPAENVFYSRTPAFSTVAALLTQLYQRTPRGCWSVTA